VISWQSNAIISCLRFATVDIVACVWLFFMLLSDDVLLFSLLHVLHFFGALFCVVAVCVACRAAWVYDTVSLWGALLGGGHMNGELSFCVDGSKVMHWHRASAYESSFALAGHISAWWGIGFSMSGT